MQTLNSHGIKSLARRSVRAALAALGALAAAGCVPLGQARYWDSRPVLFKDGTTTLISARGARCEVSSEEHATILIGEKHRCLWQLPKAGEGPTKVMR